ncbi:MAG: hypothetical protein JSS63_09540 [Bacteroidetes bacterium]|nr:hypothetical protein [Bacteroidota bacterium]
MVKEIISEVTQEKFELLKTKDVENVKNGSTEKIYLELDNTKGDTEIAINTAEYFSKSESDLVINIIGDLSPAGVLLAAIGEPKFRIADKKATFRLGDANKYSADATEKDLTSEDRELFEILSAITKERDLILEKIISGDVFDAYTARDLNIVDVVPSYDDKYKRRRKRNKSNNSAKVNTVE